MFIQSERIYLRDIREEDLNQDFWDAVNDPDIMKYSEQRHFPITKEDFTGYWEKHHNKKDEPWMMILLKDGNLHIGNIKVGPINWIHRRAEVSLWLLKSYWNQGLGTEAINLIVDYAFKRLNLCKLTAGIYKGNEGSIKAFSKAGFQPEGILTKQIWFESSWMDVVLMAVWNDT